MIVIVLLLLLGGLVCVGFWAKLRSRDLDAWNDLQDDFFRAATALVDNEATPESVVDFVEFAARKIGDPRAPWRLLELLIVGAVRKTNERPPVRVRQLAYDVDTLESPLDQQFAKAAINGILAMSYNSVIAGRILRRLAMYRINKSDKKHYDGADDAGALISGLAGA